jgi:hypothetical protein
LKLKEQIHTLEHWVAPRAASDIRGDGPAEPIKLTQLQAQALSILGVSPVVGRPPAAPLV